MVARRYHISPFDPSLKDVTSQPWKASILRQTLQQLETPEELHIKFMLKDFPVAMFEIVDAAACFIANHWRKKGKQAKSMFTRKPWLKPESNRVTMQVPDGKGGWLTVEMEE